MQLERTSIGTAALAWLALGLCSASVLAQPGQGRVWNSDPRAEDRTYLFEDTNEELPYCIFASSGVSADTPAPLIISLHGLGAPPQVMCNETAVDLAEEGGYILAAPMGYNVGGWYGSPLLRPPGGGGRGFGGAEQPENLPELSEKDVMNVLAMVREEFNVDDDRIYLTGHSMGGAGTFFLGSKHADIWAAIAPVAPAAFGMTENRADILG
ncbi:MAG TPA: alpha/beta hydrolase-fold protein, partial [Gammaproteobacteria bacterium]